MELDLVFEGRLFVPWVRARRSLNISLIDNWQRVLTCSLLWADLLYLIFCFFVLRRSHLLHGGEENRGGKTHCLTVEEAIDISNEFPEQVGLLTVVIVLIDTELALSIAELDKHRSGNVLVSLPISLVDSGGGWWEDLLEDPRDCLLFPMSEASLLMILLWPRRGQAWRWQRLLNNSLLYQLILRRRHIRKILFVRRLLSSWVLVSHNNNVRFRMLL